MVSAQTSWYKNSLTLLTLLVTAQSRPQCGCPFSLFITIINGLSRAFQHCLANERSLVQLKYLLSPAILRECEYSLRVNMNIHDHRSFRVKLRHVYI